MRRLGGRSYLKNGSFSKSDPKRPRENILFDHSCAEGVRFGSAPTDPLSSRYRHYTTVILISTSHIKSTPGVYRKTTVVTVNKNEAFIFIRIICAVAATEFAAAHIMHTWL